MGDVSYSAIQLRKGMTPVSMHTANILQPTATIVCCYLDHVSAIQTANIQGSSGNPDGVDRIAPLSVGELETLINTVQKSLKHTIDQ